MFDFVRNHTRLFQFVLVLIIFPSFVFFGIQGYSRFTGGANTTVAKVAGRSITQAEWDAAQRDQVERLRRQMPGIDAKVLDTPQMRRRSLDNLVRDQVLLAAADKMNLVTTDERMQRLFVSEPQFAPLRNPDGSVKQEVLRAQGMNSRIFAERLRQELTMQQVLQGVGGTVFAPDAVAASTLDPYFQQREVQVQRFDPKDYAAKVSATDAQVEAYYKDPAHASEFQAPEQEDIQYVMLDVASLEKSVNVTDSELRDYYKQNESRYQAPEERRASHILVKVSKNAPPDVRAKAKAKAEKLLAEVKKDPSSFAEIAKKNSDDPGSAEHGGDLDFFGRGAMVKPFEDAAFSMKPGEISDLVQTDFGYHIIMVTGARGGEKKTFEQVRPQVEQEVRKQLAQKKYSDIALDFSNMVYEQADSLKPVADKYHLEVRTAQGVKRTPGANGQKPPLNSAKFLDALFSNDVIKNNRNTDAIETGPNQLASGHVIKYSPAHTLPFAEVKDKVREKVTHRLATELAAKEGQTRLAELKKDTKAAMPADAVVISRAQSKGLPAEVVDDALKADASALPAVVGVTLADGSYDVVRVNKVLGRDPVAADAAKGREQYAQAWGDALGRAYFDALKGRMNVDIDEKVVSEAASKDASR